MAVVKLLALVLATVTVTACASSGAVPRPFPGATSQTAPAAQPASTSVLIARALMYRGVPYRNGGSDPSGFDCSGFVQWVFAQEGIALPREVREQYQLGRNVDRRDVRPGDLVFFETVSHGASHVGIALGNDQFVHAPSSRGVVRVETYTSDYWKKRYVGARRLATKDVKTD